MSRAEGGLVQWIGHATSGDLHNWERVGTGLCLDIEGPGAEHYDTVAAAWDHRAFRDPWVMRSPDGDGWIMMITTRLPGREETNDGGAIGIAVSDDLHQWMRAPLHVGGFGQLEVPQLVCEGDRWFCLFCTDAGHFAEGTWAGAAHRPETGSHYLVADHRAGPLVIAPGPMFDGAPRARRYASHLARTGDGLRLLGFRDGKGNGFGGYVMDPAPVTLS